MMLLQSEMGIIILLTDPATIIFGYVTAQPQIPAHIYKYATSGVLLHTFSSVTELPIICTHTTNI